MNPLGDFFFRVTHLHYLTLVDSYDSVVVLFQQFRLHAFKGLDFTLERFVRRFVRLLPLRFALLYLSPGAECCILLGRDEYANDLLAAVFDTQHLHWPFSQRGLVEGKSIGDALLPFN